MSFISHHRCFSPRIHDTSTFAFERVHDEKRSGKRKYENRTKGVDDHQEGRGRIGYRSCEEEGGFPLDGRDRCLVACAVEGEESEEG